MIDKKIPATVGRAREKGRAIAKLSHYLDLVKRRWWVPVLGLAAGAVVAVLMSKPAPPLYASVGRMIVSLKINSDKGVGGGYTEDLNNFLGTQAALMESDVVSNRAGMRLAATSTNLQGKSVSLRVSVSPKTSIFVFRGTSSDPEAAQKYVQACMEEYINLKRDMRKQASDNTVADMTEETQALEKSLRAAQEEMVAFESTNSLVWLQQQGNSIGTYVAGLNQKLADMKSEENLLKTLTLDQNIERQGMTPLSTQTSAPANTNGASGSSVSNSTPQGGTDQFTQDYLKAKQQVMLEKADMDEMGQFLKPNHPKMVAMREDIARSEKLLDIFRGQSAEQLENQKVALRAQIQNTEEDLRSWDAKVVELSRKTAEYERLKASTQRISSLYEQLLASIQTIDVNKGITAESVSIEENASAASLVPVDKTTTPVAAGVACFLLSVGFLLVMDHLDDRLNSLSDLQEIFTEDVLVQVPRENPLSQDAETQLIWSDDKRHSFIEAYRSLRSSLIYMSQTGSAPKTMLVTSSIPNEGKSMTSANLAIIMALAGSRVLIVDADLRKGVLHNRFGLASDSGLSEVLTEAGDWKKSVLETKYANLFLLPRGKATQRSSELFIGPATAKFLKEAAQAYDFVILDTAPVMAADDVTSLAPHVDTTLFVLRAEFTSARIAQAALGMLYRRQVKILGIVFNAVRPNSTGYYYYYKYKDYYNAAPDEPNGKHRKLKGGARQSTPEKESSPAGKE